MTAIGATAVVLTAVRNDLKLWTIINIGSTIILWWSLFQYSILKNDKLCNIQAAQEIQTGNVQSNGERNEKIQPIILILK